MKNEKLKLIVIVPLVFISFELISQERFIEYEGRKVKIFTFGTENRNPGQPIIVFESGFGTPMDHWNRIKEGASKLGPVFMYDRPGVGDSEPDNAMPTAKYVSDHLIGLLKMLDLPPPYLLVGHSLGGAYIRGFAHYHPEMLAGLIFDDSADITETQENKRDYYSVLGWDDNRIDQEIENLAKIQAASDKNFPPSLVQEREWLRSERKNDFKEINANPLPNIPVHVIIGGRFDMPDRFKSDEYDNEALFRNKMRIRMNRWTDLIQTVDKGMLFYSGDAGHFVHYDDPDLVLSSIDLALKDYEKMKNDK